MPPRPMHAHGRYDYCALPDRPVFDWPGGHRLAVYVALNVETFRFGGGEGAGAWAHFLPTWSRRTRRAWFLFFRCSPSRFRQLGSTTGEVQNLSINVVCALHGTHGVKTKS